MRSLALAALVLFPLAAGCGGGASRRRQPPPPPSPLQKALIRTARSWLPEEDGNRPPPKDCSDFVRKVFSAHKLELPRSSDAMSKAGDSVGSSRELRMADLVFFAGSKGGKSVGHVGIYVNNGIFIHQANPGEGVRMESMHSDYYRKRYLKARRVAN